MSKLGDIFNKHTEQKSFTDSAKHWQGLEAMLDANDAKKKRGGLIWWLSGITFVSLIGIGGWSLLDTSSTTDIASVEGATQKNKVEEVHKSSDKNAGISIEQNKVSELENDISFYQIQQSDKNSKIENNLSTDSQESDLVNDDELAEDKAILNDIPKLEDTPISAIDESSEFALEKSFATLPEIDNNISDRGEDDSDFIAPFDQNESHTITQNDPSKEFRIFDLELMNLLGTSILENEVAILTPSEKDFLKKENNLQFEVGLYGGGMYVGKNLKSNSNFIDRRNKEETGMLSFNSGLDLNMKLGKFCIGTGLNYHQQGEVINYSNQYEDWVTSTTRSYEVSDNSYWQINTTSFSIITDENYTTQVDTTFTFWDDGSGMYVTDTISVQAYVINNLGTQQFNLTDSTYVQQIDSVENVTLDSSLQTITDANDQRKTTTKFSYLEIPILIGYEFPINRMVISLKTGVGVGFLTQQNATYWVSDIGAPQLLSRSEVNSIMLNYLLSVGLNYHVTENWSLRAEPFYRLNLTNVLNSSDISQKYWNAGLNVGVVYGF